jgi:hypothetical protein
MEYAPELKLPSNVSILKPKAKASVDNQNIQDAPFPVTLTNTLAIVKGPRVINDRKVSLHHFYNC